MEVTAEQMVQLKCVLMDCGQIYVIGIGVKLIAGFSVNNCLDMKILVCKLPSKQLNNWGMLIEKSTIDNYAVLLYIIGTLTPIPLIHSYSVSFLLQCDFSYH